MANNISEYPNINEFLWVALNNAKNYGFTGAIKIISGHRDHDEQGNILYSIWKKAGGGDKGTRALIKRYKNDKVAKKIGDLFTADKKEEAFKSLETTPISKHQTGDAVDITGDFTKWLRDGSNDAKRFIEDYNLNTYNNWNHIAVKSGSEPSKEIISSQPYQDSLAAFNAINTASDIITDTETVSTVDTEKDVKDVDKTNLQEFYDNLAAYKEMETSSYDLKEEEIKSLKSDIHDFTYSFYKDGIKGDDDVAMRSWIKGLSQKIGIDKLDKTNPEDMAKARAMLSFAINHVKGEKYAENITGDTDLIDSKLEDVFEDNNFREDILLPSVDIPTKNDINNSLKKELIDSPFSKYFKRETFSKDLGPQISYNFEDESAFTRMLADHDPRAHKEFVTTGTIPEDIQTIPTIDPIQFETPTVDEIIPPSIKPADIPSDVPTDDKGLTFGKVEKGIGKAFQVAGNLLDMVGGPGAIISYIMGKKGLKHAMKEVVPKESAKLSPLFMQHFRQTRELAKKGFHPNEAQKIRREIDNSYQTALENSVRGTAGDRAKFLANSGVLDAQRSSALLDFATKDAALQRQNQDKYAELMMFKENFDAKRTEKERAEDLQMQLMDKQSAINFTSTAFSNAISGLGGGSNSLMTKIMKKFINGTSDQTTTPFSSVTEKKTQ